MLEIIRALQKSWDERNPVVIATVIGAEGSVYRREGARCVVQSRGEVVGAISGGCIESDLYEHVQQVLSSGSAKIIDYDFRGTADLLWGLGVGCNGAVKVLLQPFDPVVEPNLSGSILKELRERLRTDKDYYVATVIDSADDTQVPIGTLIYAGEQEGLFDTLIQETSVTIHVEHVMPRHRVFIFGAGADAQPLVRLLHFLEWHVTIVDHRSAWATRVKFPDADEIVVIDRKQYDDFTVPETAYVVIMTHNYEIDTKLLSRLLHANVPYVGVLGPKRRINQLLSEINPTLDLTQINALHAPIGLDLGAESPEEIALSIVAELHLRREGRTGHSLKHRDEPIHR